MKKVFKFKLIIDWKLINLISILIIIISPVISAQDVTTNWPYMYTDFIKGTVYYKDSAKTEALMNIHLLRSKLHYLDKEIIKEARNSDILVVEIGNDKYYAFNDLMLKVISGNQTSFLGELTKADMVNLNASGGAYGSSSNSQATRKLSSLDDPFRHNTNHIELKNNKEGGTLLPVSKKYYIVTGGEIYLATQKGIESKLSDDEKKRFKVFLKQNKIKWKTPESLVKLFEFFDSEK